MKNLLAALLFSLLLFSGVVSAAFPDVNGEHPHRVAIETLVTQGVVKGYESGNFEPLWPVTRAEALKIILMGMEVTVDESSTTSTFSDVSSTDWFMPFVATAVENEIVKGYPDGSFKPHKTVSRAEAAKMLLVASGLPADALDPKSYLDVPADAWFFDHVNFMSAFNIEPSQTDGLWHPEQDMTRGNLAEMVYRLQHYKDTGAAFDESTNWLRKGFPDAHISMKVPFGWEYDQEGLTAVWLMDEANGQASLLTPEKNGATLFISVTSNTQGLSSEAWLDSIESKISYPTARGGIGGEDLPTLTVYVDSDQVFREWYVILRNGDLLHLRALRGTGNYRETLETTLEEMVLGLQYEATASGLSTEEAVSAIRSAIQVDGIGQSMIELLDDATIIETDPIGIGTGPVDYFYSPAGNITIKYERSLDVILAVREGRTSAF